MAALNASRRSRASSSTRTSDAYGLDHQRRVEHGPQGEVEAAREDRHREKERLDAQKDFNTPGFVSERRWGPGFLHTWSVVFLVWVHKRRSSHPASADRARWTTY
jgi:hypothetical protein